MNDDDDNLFELDPEVCDTSDNGRCHIVNIVVQSLETMATVLKSWSPKRLSKESDSVQSVFAQIKRCIAGFSHVRMNDCRLAWGKLIADCNASRRHTDWPPCTIDDAVVQQQADETCLDSIAPAVDMLITILDSVGKFCPALMASLCGVRDELATCTKLRRLRTLLWTGCKAMLRALRCPPQDTCEQ